MINNKIKIEQEYIKKKISIKYEIKKIILKNIIQNKNIQPITRAVANYKLHRLDSKINIPKHKNVCLKTGRGKGVYKNTNLSRHYMKYLLKHNNLQNIKIHSW